MWYKLSYNVPKVLSLKGIQVSVMNVHWYIFAANANQLHKVGMSSHFKRLENRKSICPQYDLLHLFHNLCFSHEFFYSHRLFLDSFDSNRQVFIISLKVTYECSKQHWYSSDINKRYLVHFAIISSSKHFPMDILSFLMSLNLRNHHKPHRYIVSLKLPFCFHFL